MVFSPFYSRIKKTLVLAGLALSALSCTHYVALEQRFSQYCPSCVKSIILRDVDTPLLLLTRATEMTSQPVRVYIDGDGTPWERPWRAAHKPRIHNPVALRLLQKDPAGGFYLGRPCYGLSTLPADCKQVFWTEGRYGADVIKLLHKGLDHIKIESSAEKITLVGFSGGGALAVILASERPDIASVITIAGNLDHTAWTQGFKYRALDASINPIDRLPFKIGGRRIHLTGKKDTQVPEALMMKAINQDTNAIHYSYPDFSHTCCWDEIWQQFLEQQLLP